MKEIFFKGLVVALPIVVIGGLIYAIFLGFYQLYADMKLKKELQQIEREAKERRRQKMDPTSKAEAQTYSVDDLFQ